MDRISRQSGPLRSFGRSRRQLADLDEPKVKKYEENGQPFTNSTADVEELASRPAKRRRREGSAANSLESGGNSLLTLRSSQKGGGKVAELDEYRDVERQLIPPRIPRRSSSGSKKQQRRVSLDDDVREIVPIPDTSNKHKYTASVEMPLHPAGRDRNVGTSLLQLAGRLRDSRERFSRRSSPVKLQVNDRRNVSDSRESPDELQGEATVVPDCRMLGTRRKAEATTRSPKIAQVEITDHPERSKSRGKDAAARESGRDRLFNADSFRFGTMERLSSEGNPITIRMNEREIRTVGGGTAEEGGESKVALRKVREVLCGAGDSRKVRLKLASSEGTAGHVDIQLSSIKDRDAFRMELLSMPDVKLQNRPRYVFLSVCFGQSR